MWGIFPLIFHRCQMLAHIITKGVFSFEVGHWVTKCERNGLEKPQVSFTHSRGTIAKRCTHVWRAEKSNQAQAQSWSLDPSDSHIGGSRVIEIIELHED
jgi:hypothetical protein